jgi:hypothetical protein
MKMERWRGGKCRCTLIECDEKTTSLEVGGSQSSEPVSLADTTRLFLRE